MDDDRVGPLYEHTFPPSLAPSLSFVGIPRKVKKKKKHFIVGSLGYVWLPGKFLRENVRERKEEGKKNGGQ